MSGPKNIIPSAPLHTHLPMDIRAKIDLHLFSEVEGRIPKGAYQRFLTELINQFFENRVLDLAPYLNTQPGVNQIRGEQRTIDLLKEYLTLINERRVHL